MIPIWESLSVSFHFMCETWEMTCQNNFLFWFWASKLSLLVPYFPFILPLFWPFNGCLSKITTLNWGVHWSFLFSVNKESGFASSLAWRRILIWCPSLKCAMFFPPLDPRTQNATTTLSSRVPWLLDYFSGSECTKAKLPSKCAKPFRTFLRVKSLALCGFMLPCLLVCNVVLYTTTHGDVLVVWLAVLQYLAITAQTNMEDVFSAGCGKKTENKMQGLA